MISKYSAYQRGEPVVSPNIVDRILIGLCAAVWLLLVGVGVAAIVALVDLGRGFHKMARNPHTTWVLYVIIAVSALIIVAAIPVLLRARRPSQAVPAARSGPASERGASRPTIRTGQPMARTPAGSARTEKLIGFGPAAVLSDTAVERVWLRGTIMLIGTMGAALVGVAAATYLMAIGRDSASWTSYAIAGIVTATIPAIPWRHVRHLRILVAHRGVV